MSYKPTSLIFDLDLVSIRSEDYVARIPASLNTREKLFDALIQQLKLPAYFGENWDALSECLRDLSWIKTKRVIIVHSDLPPLDRHVLKTYLDVLEECITDWKPEEDHELFAVFPAYTREMILLLREDQSPQ